MKKSLLFYLFIFQCIFAFSQSTETFETRIVGEGEANGGSYQYEAKVNFKIMNAGLGDISMLLGISEFRITSFRYKGINPEYNPDFDLKLPIEIKNHQAKIEGRVKLYSGYSWGISYSFEEAAIGQGSLIDRHYFSKEDVDDIVDRLRLKENKDNLSSSRWDMDAELISGNYFSELSSITRTIDNSIRDKNRIQSLLSQLPAKTPTERGEIKEAISIYEKIKELDDPYHNYDHKINDLNRKLEALDKEEAKLAAEAETQTEEEGGSSGGGGSLSPGAFGSSKNKEKKEGKKKEEKEGKEKDEVESDSTTTYYHRESTPEEIMESQKETIRELNDFAYENEAENYAERQRRARVNDYKRDVEKQTASNSEAATEMGAGVAALAIMVGAIMYRNLGNTREVNVFKGDAPRFNLNFGYTTTWSPIVSEVTTTTFDGNSYNQNTEDRDYLTSTLDLEFGTSFYPIYGEKYGAGAFARLAAGTGLMFQNSRTEFSYGVKGYYGSRFLQFFAEVSKGQRTFRHHPWIDPEKSGGDGIKYKFLNTKVGIRFSFDMNLSGRTRAHVELAPIFELAETRSSSNPIFPFQRNLTRGFYAALNAEHRLKFFANIYPDFPRANSRNAGNDGTGYFVQAGILRNVDYFSEGGGYAGRSPSDVDRKKGWGISFLGPGVTWIRSKQDTFSISNYDPTISIIKITKDFQLSPSISLFTGGDLTYNLGSHLTFTAPFGSSISTFGKNYQGRDQIRISGGSVIVPVGLRIKLGSKYALKKPWVKVGIRNHFKFFNRLDLNESGEFVEEESAQDYFETRTMSMMIGGGVDVPVGYSAVVRLGITYDRGMSSISNDAIDIRSEALNLSFGILF